MGHVASKQIINKSNLYPYPCGRDICHCLICFDLNNKEQYCYYKSCYDTWYHFYYKNNNFNKKI